ncbi:MAG: lysophospholipid acyltransferase family protein [Planctomycetota bacterium]
MMKSGAERVCKETAAIKNSSATPGVSSPAYWLKVGPTPGMDFVFYLCKLMTWVFFPLLFKFRVHGRQHIPLDTGALITSNHQSYLDPVFIGAAARRRTGYIARKTLFKAKSVFTHLISAYGALPMSVDSSSKEGVRLAVEHLRRKEHIAMFPEGTRTRDGSIGPVHPGAKLIAQKAGVPIVPMALHGAFEIWPRTKKIFGLGPVSVAFGKPIRPGQLREMKASEFCVYLRKRLVALYTSLANEKARRPSV